MRFDQFVANELNISRNKALELIKNGSILLNGEVCMKPSNVVSDAKIELLDEIYVSRGALKLRSFLSNLPDDLRLDLVGKSALDVGSSTGGFVQILLQNGVKSVVALDVGSSQLDGILRRDERVEVIENTDIREFAKAFNGAHKSQDIDLNTAISQRKFDLITCDVSFISLNLIVNDIALLAGDFVIFLFKPQFEVGKEAKRDKKGVVKDAKAISQARSKFEILCAQNGFVLLCTKECDIRGKEGNLEYFYLFKKSGCNYLSAL